MEINPAFSIRPQAALSLAADPARSAARAIRVAPEAKSANEIGRERVGELVGSIFYGQLMRQMNQSSLRSDLFHGGRGEEAFQGQLVQHLGERIGRSKNEPVANAIHRTMQRRLGNAADGAAA
ncbi:hypothetical protein RAS2_01080 [Phycisphaerae bacterium RAS2]|nr:hypothetical protein RAS2_01080 [Phycisphaerae bacterium RAS2]